MADSAASPQPAPSASRSALVHGARRTRETLATWQHDPLSALRPWLAGSLLASCTLLLAVWAVAGIVQSVGLDVQTIRPPFAVGRLSDVATILERNLLVLSLHAMACVAGFIAGSSLPLAAESHHGVRRVLHERGGRFAIVFVIGATTFSLSAQALVLGLETSAVAARLHTAPGLLLVVLAPHALLELTALFLPLAAWIIASRRAGWDELLAATAVTCAVALPMLLVAALIEVYVSPHLLHFV